MFGTVSNTALILIVISFVVLGQCELQLKLVQVLFRHGDRTPSRREMYPKDPHNVSAYQPFGLGQLTNVGKMRAYDLGKMLKSRYKDLLGSVYHPEDVYAYNSNIKRTKTSLQLALAGLYPPSAPEVWNAELPWSPIPTHYAPMDVDILMFSSFCPQYIAARREINVLPEIKNKIGAHTELFKFLTVNTGSDITNTNRLSEVYRLLIAQKSMNLTMPEWCTNGILQQMADVAVLELELHSYTKKLKRLNGGTLVRRFMENMNVQGNRENPRKVYLYSGHDVNVAAFLRAHGLNEPRLPDFGAAVMVEKLQDNQGNYFVRMVLWTGVNREADHSEVAWLRRDLSVRHLLEFDTRSNTI